MNTRGALYDNLTATKLVKLGSGKVYGLVVNSHTNGTMKLTDGVDDTAGAKATAVLTIGGGSLTPAKFAKSILTSDATDFSDGETVTIGSVVYRMKSTMTQAFDVKIGASVTATLASLKKAINATGVAGTDYFAGTTAHPLVIASASDATTLTVYSRTYGTANNTLATTETSAHYAWEASTLGAGTGASIAGVATADATFVINGTSYYLTTLLSETLLTTAVVNEILWVTSDAVALDNVKLAINGTGVEGTDYSTGTNANSDVIATTNTNTAQTFEARVFGTLGNQLTSTETMVNASFAGTTFSGGTDASRLMINTYTFPSGSQTVLFAEPINFVNGLFFTVGGTLDATVLFN